MFGRTGNAKPSVTQASAWVTYLLLAIGIFTPVVCVIWLVQKTVESENALVHQLVEDARKRSLADTADLVRLTALGMVPDSSNGGVRYSWAETPLAVTPEDAEAAKAKLSEVRARLTSLSGSQVQRELAGLIADPALSEYALVGGRSLDLLLIEMGLRSVEGENELDAGFLAASEALLLRKMEQGRPSRQLRYTLRQYAEVSGSPRIVRLAEAEGLADRWVEFMRASNNWPPAGGLGSGDGFFYLVNGSEAEAFIFPDEALVRASENLESLRNKRFSLSLKGDGEESGYRLKAPLDFLYLQEESGAVSSKVSSGKAVMYIWIGGIVLGLSILSGVAIVVSVRRQASVTRLKDNLVATVTHELKTPVASIRLLVDTLLNEERRGKVDTQEYIELISRENLRLGRLIDNFLSFSRMERSKGSFDIVAVDPAEVVAAAEQAFRERFQGQRFTLDVEVGAGLRRILGDADALATVIGNLLENAFKYGGADRRIVLRALDGGDGLDFVVQDFGQGIPRREQKRIFRKFYQVQGRSVNQSGSVGLGLSIVDFIVSKHSGRVVLESEEGKGSVFKVRIPYA